MDPTATLGDLPEAQRATPTTVRSGEPISKAIEGLLAHPRGRSVYVVDGERRLLGVVSFRDVLRVSNARLGAREAGLRAWLRQLRDLLPERVDDIMREPTPVRETTPLREALALLERTKQNDLPIVDDEGRVVSELNALQVLDVALRVFQRTEEDLRIARERPTG